LPRRKELDSLSQSVLRFLVIKVIQEGFRDDHLIGLLRRNHLTGNEFLESRRLVWYGSAGRTFRAHAAV
jgi:hypothetical protein